MEGNSSKQAHWSQTKCMYTIYNQTCSLSFWIIKHSAFNELNSSEPQKHYTHNSKQNSVLSSVTWDTIDIFQLLSCNCHLVLKINDCGTRHKRHGTKLGLKWETVPAYLFHSKGKFITERNILHNSFLLIPTVYQQQWKIVEQTATISFVQKFDVFIIKSET